MMVQKFKHVKATLIQKDDPSKTFDVELKDDGIAEDSVKEIMYSVKKFLNKNLAFTG